MAESLLRFFHPIATSSSLGRSPRAVSLAGEPFVVFRDGSGQPAILRDRCPHRFAPLSKGRIDREGNLSCAYHGWTFDRDGRGRSPTQPSLTRCDVDAFQAIERFGCVWLANRGVPLDRFPSMGWDGFEYAGVFDMLFRAPLHVALDNFSEDEHTPFVHTRLGWDASQVGDVTFAARRFDDRTEVEYTAPQRPSRLVRALGLHSGDLFHNDWVTRFDPVRTDYTISWTSPTTGELRPVVTRAVIFMVPETDRTTRFFVFSFVKLVDRRLRPLMPLVKRAAKWLGWYEVRDDARFIPTVADTPLSMKGMRLGRFDEPLVHNHRLLERVYYGRSAVDLPVVKDVEIAR